MHISRENALLGNYKASLVYFDGVIGQIQRNLRPVDNLQLTSQWQKAKEELDAEFRIVKNICLELNHFKKPPEKAFAPAAAPARASTGCSAPAALIAVSARAACLAAAERARRLGGTV